MRNELPVPGAVPLSGGGTAFSVWAPSSKEVDLVLDGGARVHRMERDENGYHRFVVDDAGAGTRYVFRLDGGVEHADPASRFQPRGVHRPSEVVDPRSFAWSDDGWRGLRLAELAIMEIHVGAFSEAGTFDGVIPYLDDLRALGITAIELMPVAQFPGKRNWGYDGVYPYAAQHSYGGPFALARLVDECHARGMAVLLDVVYNHLGPEGNHLAGFGPYFTSRYRTPWGDAVNYDGEGSDDVRAFFIGNALWWLRDLHVDGLRLDAVHGIVDQSASPFLRELSETVDEVSDHAGRRMLLIAESDLNDSRVIRPRIDGGLGMHAQWNDDFHHAMHALVTRERTGYYEDFGSITHLAKAFDEGYAYTGGRSVYRGRRHGNASGDLPPERFVAFAQNHDQTGNRMLGERSSALASFEQLKLLAATVVLSPYVPLLFMGEEYAETAPFLYFVSHSEPELIDAVRRGRREEFAAFEWEGDPPDPQDRDTFARSRLTRAMNDEQRTIKRLYAELFRVRRELGLATVDRAEIDVTVFETHHAVALRRPESLLLLCYGEREQHVPVSIAGPDWRCVIDTARFPSTRAAGVSCTHGVDVRPWSALLLHRRGDA